MGNVRNSNARLVSAGTQVTPRELEMVRLIAEGHSTKIIAEKMGISVKTAETHRANLYKRVGVTNVVELLKVFYVFAERGTKASILLVLSLLLAQGVDAKPWYKDWKVWAVVGASIGASAAATHYAHECREQFGPAPCQGGYGSFKAREGLRMGLAAGLSAHAIWGRHEGFKEWPVFALGFAAYNTSVAVRQSRIGCPAGEEFVYGTKFTCRLSDEGKK